jgi:hypothetical protein
VSIQCIYKARKSGKKTNRCQTIIQQKSINLILQIDFYLITYVTYPKRKVTGKKQGTGLQQKIS